MALGFAAFDTWSSVFRRNQNWLMFFPRSVFFLSLFLLRRMSWRYAGGGKEGKGGEGRRGKTLELVGGVFLCSVVVMSRRLGSVAAFDFDLLI